jgi:hypothetical protein
MECHECGADISEKAADCPHCGTSVRDLSAGANADDGGGDGRGTPDDRPTDGGGDTGDDGPEEPTVPASSTDSPPSRDQSESGGTDPLRHGSSGSDTEHSGPGGGPEESEPVSSGTEGEPETGRETVEGSEPAATDEGSEPAATDEETGWEAAGPPPEERETTVDRDVGGDPTDRETTVESEPGTVDRGTDAGSREPTDSDVGSEEDRRGPTVPGSDGAADAGSSDPDVREGQGGGRAEFGTGTGEGTGAGREAGTGTGDETSDAGATADESGIAEIDPMEQVKSLPFLTAPLAGVVTAVVLAVVSTVVGVLVPGTGPDTVAVGTTVLFDVHFATDGHLPVGLLTQFETARPPNATLGILYLLPPLFLYTAAKFVTAYNVEERTLTPVAGVGGALVAVGYFPAMLVAFVLAPGGPLSPVKLLPAILLAGLVYPVLFGGIGGLVAGTLSGSERRIGTLYGVVSFFLIAVGSVVLTITAIQLPDVGPLAQIHASLFTVVAANGLRLGNPDIGALVLLAYPMVALVVFGAGALRAWNAEDVTGPLRGVAKGLSPVPTYFTLLGLLATVLPLLADPWIARELGLSPNGEALVRFLVQAKLLTIGQYVSAVFVGTLAYAVFLGGFGGLMAGVARYVLSDEE